MGASVYNAVCVQGWTPTPHSLGMAENWRDRFRQRFYQLKHAEGLTQEILAERVGVSQPTIGHWLNERRTPDTLDLYESLANGLKVTPQWLLYGIEDQPISREQFSLLRSIQALSTDDQAAIRAVLLALENKNHPEKQDA